MPGGVVHKLPTDLRKALSVNPAALEAWKDITPLARNEFICWVEDAKQTMTRERRIRRTQEELEEGQRRPCCWPGSPLVCAAGDVCEAHLDELLHERLRQGTIDREVH